MFAFDSFLIVGNVSSNVQNPKKNIPLSIILSMIICGVFYFLVTISQLLCGYGNPYGIFQDIFKDNQVAVTAFTVIMSVFMAISLFGCVTSLSSAFINSTQSAIDEGVIIGSTVMKRIGNKSRNKLTPGLIMSLIIISFWFLVFGILSAVLNTDQIFDGLSNIVVVLIFTVYGFVTLMSVVNRKTNKVPASEVAHQKGQIPLAIIGAIGCFAIPLYQMIYVFIYQVAIDPTAPYHT
jgi:amino acid transporter